MNKLRAQQTLIFVTLYIGYGLYQMNRRALVQMSPFIVDNTNLTKEDIGVLITTQNVAYTFGKLLSGFMADVYSCQYLFAGGLCLTSLINVCLYKSIKTSYIYVLMLGNGLAQGPSWPAAVKILQNWTPKPYFTTAWCVLSTGSNVFGALSSFLFTMFALKYHWSYGLLIPGCISMSFSYLCLLFVRNKPSDTGYANFKHTKKDAQKSRTSPDLWPVIKQLFRYPYFHTLIFLSLITNFLKIVYSDWIAFYLIKIKYIDGYRASSFTSSYEMGGLVSSIVSGIIMDYLLYLKDNNKLKDKNPRVTLLFVFTSFSLVSFYLFANSLDSSVDILGLISIGFFAGFSIYGPTTLIGVMAIEFGSIEISGTSHSIVSLASNLAAILAGYPFSLLTKIYSWQVAFNLIQILLALGCLCLIASRNFETKFLFKYKKQV